MIVSLQFGSIYSPVSERLVHELNVLVQTANALTLEKKAPQSTEMSVTFCQSTRCEIPEHRNFHFRIKLLVLNFGEVPMLN